VAVPGFDLRGVWTLSTGGGPVLAPSLLKKGLK